MIAKTSFGFPKVCQLQPSASLSSRCTVCIICESGNRNILIHTAFVFNESIKVSCKSQNIIQLFVQNNRVVQNSGTPSCFHVGLFFHEVIWVHLITLKMNHQSWANKNGPLSFDWDSLSATGSVNKTRFLFVCGAHKLEFYCSIKLAVHIFILNVRNEEIGK